MSSQPTTTDKRVQFYPSVKLRMYPMPTKEDHQASWYNREDFFSIRHQRNEDIQTVRKMGIEQAEKLSITTLGIRPHLSAQKRQIRELRRDSQLYYVLREQYRQLRKGINDPEAIAMSCRHISDESTTEALHEARRAEDSSLELDEECTFEQKTCTSNECTGFIGAKGVVISDHRATSSLPLLRSATAA